MYVGKEEILHVCRQGRKISKLLCMYDRKDEREEERMKNNFMKM
jgi:hypothetical protein